MNMQCPYGVNQECTILRDELDVKIDPARADEASERGLMVSHGWSHGPNLPEKGIKIARVRICDETLIERPGLFDLIGEFEIAEQ